MNTALESNLVICSGGARGGGGHLPPPNKFLSFCLSFSSPLKGNLGPPPPPPHSKSWHHYILLWWNLCHHRVRCDAFVVVSKCRNVLIKTLAAMFESIADYHLKRLMIHWKKPTSDDQRPSRDLMTLWRSGSVWMKRSMMLALRSLGQCLGLPSFRFRRHTLRICRRYKKRTTLSKLLARPSNNVDNTVFNHWNIKSDNLCTFRFRRHTLRICQKKKFTH